MSTNFLSEGFAIVGNQADAGDIQGHVDLGAGDVGGVEADRAVLDVETRGAVGKAHVQHAGVHLAVHLVELVVERCGAGASSKGEGGQGDQGAHLQLLR